MITETSPISEIAIEAKDTSDDVRQVSMAIEASCKHVDHNVSSIKLSDVPKFIDDFPISNIEITPGMVGYGVDTKGVDYDITSIGYKTIYPNDKEVFTTETSSSRDRRLTPVLYDETKFLTLFSSDGILAYCSFDTGELIQTVSAVCQSFAVSPSGLIACYDNRNKGIYDVNNETLNKFNARASSSSWSVFGIAFPNDEDIYLIVGSGTEVALVRTKYGSKDVVTDSPTSVNVESLPITKVVDGHIFVVTSTKIIVYNDKGERVSVIFSGSSDFNRQIYKLDVSGDKLFIMGVSGELYICNWKTGTILSTKSNFFASTNDTILCDNDTFLVCYDQQVKRYDLDGNLLFSHLYASLGYGSFLMRHNVKPEYRNFYPESTSKTAMKNITSNKETKLIANAKKRG